jgi:Asp-tRNA(Asn)/Glu-tRNA(Gln) amidotransferase A subunit family amidase
VTFLAKAVARRRVTAREVVDEALLRIERSNEALNAVVAMRPDQAVEEADLLDRVIASGSWIGPLAGVPVLVKDMEDVAGMRTTFGSRLFMDSAPAEADSAIPARLRAAGAIIVGKSNLPEFATEGFTDNLVFGPTRNPWASAWSPGGSSGGSAAAVSAGMVPIATATDGGGSIRIPAAFCGLVGIKPTLGVVSREKAPDWIDLTTHGPLATSVEDLRRVLRVETGRYVGDPNATPFEWERQPSQKPLRLFAVDRTSDLGPLPDEVAAKFNAAVDALAAVLGLSVTWLEAGLFPDGDPDLDWFTLATAEHINSVGRPRVEAGLSDMHPAARAFMEVGLEVSIDAYLDARRRRFSYVKRLDDLLGVADLLLTPTVASAGWYADGRLTLESEPGPLPPEVYSTAVQNVTGHPAISLPAGVSANGVPFGLQITGPRFSDAGLLDVAELWERAHPWPPVAPGYADFAARWA